jgi:hypothetical protein
MKRKNKSKLKKSYGKFTSTPKIFFERRGCFLALEPETTRTLPSNVSLNHYCSMYGGILSVLREKEREELPKK